MLALACRLLVGIGFFLAGVSLLRSGLGRTARRRVESALSGLTRTPIAAVVTGTIVTAVVHSSSAVTVMVVGLVDAGVLDLYQSFGVIMGANLGTCATAQIVSIRGEGFAIPVVCVGLAGYLLARRPLYRDLSLALAGLGCIFWGVGVTQSAVNWLPGVPRLVRSLVVLGQAPVFGVAVGAVFTGIIQSSGAVTVMLVSLARQGLVDLRAAMAVALGSNIGTCVTTLLASVGASRNAKRAALLHLAFNLVGVIAVLPVFGPFVWLVTAISPPDLGRAIANAHTLFNFLSIVVVLPWSRKFVDIVRGGCPWTS